LLDRYITKNGKSLRLGFTTGSCAALAAKAATQMLLTKNPIASVSIQTPKGIEVEAKVLEPAISLKSAKCAIKKDAGDDPDVTHEMLVFAEVALDEGSQITITGGEGVGTVTRKGLDQPVGASAINRIPRQMIAQEVLSVCNLNNFDGGLLVTISIPNGEQIAAKTFNPQLGIEGGISIIGTSGIVEPMSTQAILDTIETGMKMLHAEGAKQIVLTPGNYGTHFLLHNSEIAIRPAVKISNFVGESLDMAALYGFEEILVVGHVGKLIKLSCGVMDTHSKTADCRMEAFALQAALAGGSVELLNRILNCVTADDAIEAISKEDLQDQVMQGALDAADKYLRRRTQDAFPVGVVMFSNQHGNLGVSANAERILEGWRRRNG